MKNYVQEGNSLDFVAGAGGVKAGVTVKTGVFIHIPATDAAEGETYSGWVEGVYDLVAQTGTAWARGDLLYWDDTAKVWTKTAGTNAKGGAAAAPKASGDAVGRVKLIPTL